LTQNPKSKTMAHRKYQSVMAFSLLGLVVALLFTGNSRKESKIQPRAGYSDISFAGTDQAMLNAQVNRFVKHYVQENKDCLCEIKQRSQAPFDLMDSVLDHFQLPLQLKYLAVIESELKATAVSDRGAAGPWQLMPETAQILGLKVSRHNDERMNFSQSTRAAARYLKDLHIEFGDWLLVLAAYNGGEGPVYAAIRHANSRNFWTIQRYLPQETRTYIKKFMATYYYFEGRRA
jgi:membrane-bound lytic murein transglycosylase D